MFILLNRVSDSLILFKLWKISHFLFSSLSDLSSGHCLSFVAFPSLTMHSIKPSSTLILIMSW